MSHTRVSSPVVPLSWDINTDVLSLKTFTSSHILKWGHKGEHTCSCTAEQRHRSLFDFNLTVHRDHIANYSEERDFPKVLVCHNADNVWESKLPRDLTGLKQRVTFDNLGTVGTAMKVLSRGTYWFRRLAKGNRHVMARLLAGFSRPNGPEKIRDIMLLPLKKGCAAKLHQTLATCDGLLFQIILAFPDVEFVQNWDFIDQVQNCLISGLIYDYFHNGQERVSMFKEIKSVRKSIKEQAFRQNGNYAEIRVPRVLSFFSKLLKIMQIGSANDVYQASIISQTRASGVPPRSMYQETLDKIKLTLTTPANPQLARGLAPHIHRIIDELFTETLLSVIENQTGFFTRIVKSAKISLSDSGEFFTPVKEGGKLEASRRVLQENPKIEEINLETGLPTGKVLDESNSAVGERLFNWSCGQFRDRSACYGKNLMSMRISLVSELGKYRGITVTPIAHALLLHPVSHMGLEFLKAVPSSSSGIKAASHAWNFFKRLSDSNPAARFLFTGSQNVNIFSTDWSNATDYCDPYVSQIMLGRLLVKLGLPKWYRETVTFALMAPRQVEFKDPEDKTLDYFVTQRGVMMGDPITKVVLHLFHLTARPMARKILAEMGLDEPYTDSDESEDIPT